MFYIGCHLSASKGFLNMAKEAVSIGANTFQFFTRNPRGFAAKEIDDRDVAAFKEYEKEHNFGKILAHAPYTLNPASADERVRELALRIMQDDMERMEKIPGNLYNFHPGSHVGQGTEKGIELIVDILDNVLSKNQSTTVLLETMSGKGSEIGSSFEEIKKIIDSTRLGNKLGVCLDTCHIYDAGYDIVTDFDSVLDEFDRVIGIERLCALHINDSKNPYESHKDRHEKIGEGYIGIDAMATIINNPRVGDLPFLLETPNELEGYKKEIQILREKRIAI